MNRLLQVTPYLHPRAGGPPVVVWKHANFLVQQDWKVTVVTSDLYCEGAADDLRELLLPEVELAVLPMEGRPRWLGLGAESEATVVEAISQADLVHVHTLWHPLTSVVRRASSQQGVPYLVMPHGMLDPYSLGVRRLKKSLYMAVSERRNLTRAARMVYTTTEERDLAESSVAGLPIGGIVPLGADAPPLEQRTRLLGAFVEKFPSTKGRRLVLFLSRVHPKKGLDRLLAVMPEVAAKDPTALLAIVGSGEAEHLEAARTQVSQLGLEEHVLFCGRLSGEEKWGAYAASEMFVLPSRQENFGLVVAEAMQMALPVVVSKNVNTWSYVQQAAGGVVCSGDDLGELTRAIVLLLEDREAARSMGARGHELARQSLTWNESGRAMEAVYREVLA